MRLRGFRSNPGIDTTEQEESIIYGSACCKAVMVVLNCLAAQNPTSWFELHLFPVVSDRTVFLWTCATT